MNDQYLRLTIWSALGKKIIHIHHHFYIICKSKHIKLASNVAPIFLIGKRLVKKKQTALNIKFIFKNGQVYFGEKWFILSA